MTDEAVEIVSATRLSGEAFMETAPLGATLGRFKRDTRIRSRIFAQNSASLPVVYNQAINAADDPDIILFIHDDVWIDDIFLPDRLTEALEHFDVVGVAGNQRRVPRQAKWMTRPDAGTTLDFPHLSGSIAHARPYGPVVRLGDTPAACELLDGVFLAARRSVLKQAGVAFDPRFDFHFYDLDFCRTARARGLRVGTWPIGITHRSYGAFDSPAWRRMRDVYLAKWPD